MVDLDREGKRPRIYDRQSLKEALDSLPQDRQREACAVVAARASLRVIPLIARADNWSGGFLSLESMFALPVFWAAASARVAAKFSARASEIRASRAAGSARVASWSAADGGSVSPSAAAAAAAGADADANVNANAAFLAAGAATFDGNAADIWRSTSADLTAIEAGRSPSDLASDPLWPQGVPDWVKEHWMHLKSFLAKEHWRPWLDWYQRRLDGEELSAEIELLFATLPVDPREKDPAKQNALLAQEIERLTSSEHPSPTKIDFFISYSRADESFAREAASVLEQAGYSTFVQYKDVAPGNNFVRGPERLIALLSPAYEASVYCQAEWAAFYNRDPSGRDRRIIPFLIRETQINSLAKQVVYKSLIGLTPEQRKAAILAAVAPRKPPPAPVENITAPFDFGWTAAATLTIVAGPQNTPVFSFTKSEADHRSRLDACRKLAERLAKLLRDGGFNARPGYLRTLDEFLEDLPTEPGQGSLLLGDFAARTLHGLLVEDSDIIAPELKERLTRVLEALASLRDYYPSLQQFYADVKSGRLTQPLPIDAIEGFVRTVEEHTPDVFDEKISHALQKMEREPEASAPPSAAARTATPTLPPDPLADVDPKKSHDFGVASSVNALYKAVLKGKDISQSIKGWDEIVHKLGDNAGPVIEWLKTFLP